MYSIVLNCYNLQPDDDGLMVKLILMVMFVRFKGHESASRQGFENSCPPAKECALFLQEIETIAKAVCQSKNPKSSLSGAVDGSDNRWESYGVQYMCDSRDMFFSARAQPSSSEC